MFRMLGAAVAAVVLLCAGAAQAAVIYSENGTTNDLYRWFDLPDPGTYTVTVNASATQQFYLYFQYTEHWDTYLAPPPQPHDEYIDGNSAEVGGVKQGIGTQVTWTFTIPEDRYAYFNSTMSEYYSHRIPIGTPMYRHTFSEGPMFITIGANDGGPQNAFDYTLTIDRLSAVPEPAIWAMMIAGFGMVGLIFRTSCRRARLYQA